MRPLEVNLHNVVAVSRHPPSLCPVFSEADFPFLIGLLLQDLPVPVRHLCHVCLPGVVEQGSAILILSLFPLVVSPRGSKRLRRAQLLRLLLALGFFFLFAVSSVAFGTDSFLDSLTEFLASAAHPFTHFFTCRDGFTLLHLVA